MKAGFAAVLFGLTLGLSATTHANEFGAELFATHCAACHGATGVGDGDFGQYLTVDPSNLTVLAAENGGVFPYLDIYQVVDGRAMVRGHGASGMPIWGAIFAEEITPLTEDYDGELLVRARIVALVDYIRELQSD